MGTVGLDLAHRLSYDGLMNISSLLQDDAKKVYKDCGVSMKGCVDLSLLARSVDSRWKGKYSNPIGLSNLVATYEFLALGKGKITRSNWEAQLSFGQQECAYMDLHPDMPSHMLTNVSTARRRERWTFRVHDLLSVDQDGWRNG